MKATLISSAVLLSLLNGTEAIHHKHRYAPFHGRYMRQLDSRVQVSDPFLYKPPEDPAPEVPGGPQDDRYTSHWRKKWP